MLLMLTKGVETGSNSLYLDAMEARVRFHPDTITQFGDVIAQYQAWHQYVTMKHQVEFDDLEFSETQASYCFVFVGSQVVPTLFFLIWVQV